MQEELHVLFEDLPQGDEEHDSQCRSWEPWSGEVCGTRKMELLVQTEWDRMQVQGKAGKPL